MTGAVGKGVLVTGCNGGIGRALVSGFAAAGWTVIGVDRSGDETQAALAGGTVVADIGRFAAAPDYLREIGGIVRQRLGGAPLCAVINNAAVQHLARLDALSPAAIVETMNVNAVAPMLIVKEFLPELEANKGAVVNIGSVHAQATKPEFSAYAASKAALHGLTRALAVDLGPKVRVNTLAPAATATAMLEAGFENNPSAFEALKAVHPLRRIAEPEEIARLALFLAGDEAAFLTGTTLYADGGVLSRLHDPA